MAEDDPADPLGGQRRTGRRDIARRLLLPRLDTFNQVSSAVVTANPNGGFNCYWPMPFRRAAQFRLESDDIASTAFFFLDSPSCRRPPAPAPFGMEVD